MLEFDGVAAGFDFNVNEENGMLIFEALNNAQALPQVGVGCSAGSTTSAPAGGVAVLFAILLIGLDIAGRHVRRN